MTGGRLTVREGVSALEGFTIPLKNTMELIKRLPAHKMSELSCNYEVLRNNYGRRKGVIVLKLLLNRNLWRIGARLLFFLFSLFFKNWYWKKAEKKLCPLAFILIISNFTT